LNTLDSWNWKKELHCDSFCSIEKLNTNYPLYCLSRCSACCMIINLLYGRFAWHPWFIICSFSLQICNFFIGLYFLSVVNKFGISTVYLGFTSACALAVLYIAGNVVETKGRSLEEIARALSSPRQVLIWCAMNEQGRRHPWTWRCFLFPAFMRLTEISQLQDHLMPWIVRA
jgi:hypothetical protein